jgi:hypothetical protein
MALEVEHLPSKHKALSWNTTTAKKKFFSKGLNLKDF